MASNHSERLHEWNERRGLQSDSGMLTPEEKLRVESLKKKNELERVRKEKAVWREASRPPKALDGQSPSLTHDFEKTQAKGSFESRLFAKLRLGKFLE